ncbi:MAG: hypothetical protein C0506_03905 [Anaerolinea sp.]|nr:hypothetical protein [Anaerolinea sp.]
MIRLRPVPAAPAVEFAPWQPSLWSLIAAGAGTLGVALGVVFSVLWNPGPLAEYEYELWKWEANALIESAFALLDIGPSPDDRAGLAAIQQYFLLTSQLRAANEAASPNLDLIDTLTSERAAYENDVERVVERYIGEAVAAAGLQRQLPLFRAVSITWPPVDFELTSPPRLLVRSPRSTIKRSDQLLRNDLTLREIESIERRTDDEDTVSLVIAIGGLAAYPAIVRDDRSFDSLLDTASHEWVHHYLAFYPLGREWGKGGDSVPLNETTANIAGREIAALVQARHPIQLPEGADGRAPAGPAPTVDFNQEMHALRLEVDRLLAQGQVAEAEAAMEAKRLYLNEHGIAIRKINQAYFAFYGDYADTPASSNPIGPKIERVWEITQDVGLFLATMRNVKDAGDLDRAISRLEAGRP